MISPASALIDASSASPRMKKNITAMTIGARMMLENVPIAMEGLRMTERKSRFMSAGTSFVRR